MRLDTYEGATTQRDKGGFALHAGRSDLSLIIERVVSDDDSHRMPPPETKKRLTLTEIELLRLWIDEGGEYERHWSLIAPQRPVPPPVKDKAWPRNPIDNFPDGRSQPAPWEQHPTYLTHGRREIREEHQSPSTKDGVKGILRQVKSFGVHLLEFDVL